MRDHWQKLLAELNFKEGREKILDVGGAMDPVPIADVVIDIMNLGKGGKEYVLLDLAADTFPFPDKHFDVCICSQTLEDLTSPVLAMREMSRVAKRGIIEIPHRGAESVKFFWNNDHSVWTFGANHHKWMIEEYGDKLRFTPKRYDLLMKYPIPKWTGPGGVHWKWEGQIDFDMQYDVHDAVIDANYREFQQQNKEYWS
jgi:hypothetical protein